MRDLLGGHPTRLVHVRTAHYAVFETEPEGGSAHGLVRLGVSEPTATRGVGEGEEGAAESSWIHDQRYEFEVARLWSRHGVLVVLPQDCRTSADHDLLVLPFLRHHAGPSGADSWAGALAPLRSVHRPEWAPVFTNRAKTLSRTRLLAAPDREALTAAYDAAWDDLRRVARSWSWVHGDLHAENVIRSADSRLMSYDLDTACWAPAVWDITHLARRAGTGANVGYDVDSLRRRLGFGADEFDKACTLRAVAADVARAVRDLERAVPAA